jgi:hypothetical protein
MLLQLLQITQLADIARKSLLQMGCCNVLQLLQSRPSTWCPGSLCSNCSSSCSKTIRVIVLLNQWVTGFAVLAAIAAYAVPRGTIRRGTRTLSLT